MREKLIELLQCSPTDIMGNRGVGALADHLIANGVTLATDNNVGCKWIPVTERLPDNDGRYLVRKNIYGTPWYDVIYFAKDGRKIDEYDFANEWKNVWYRYDSEWGHVTSDSVTHWMPLPEPPKGE